MNNDLTNNPLVDLVRNRANLERINTIETAYNGGLGGQKNFKVEWNGFNNRGQAMVKYKGKEYVANNAKAYGSSRSKRQVLRVGKGVLDVM